MKKLAFLFCIIISVAKAQETQEPKPARAFHTLPSRQWYGLSGIEFIFSKGDVVNNGQPLENILRFSGFINLKNQTHYDFGKHVGMYFGSTIRNVGFINQLTIPGIGNVKMKQRSYSIGIPLAIKFGNMENGNYLAIGVEAEYMFHYKRKVFYNDHKSVFSEWFSSYVNPFNPSVFAEIRGHKGSYICFKYYLNDFLTNNLVSFYLPESPSSISYKMTKSTLWFISVGTAFRVKKKRHAKATEV